jgi:N-acyl-D-amino-acid deacylase
VARRAVGKTLSDLGRETGHDPVDAALDLLAEAEGEVTMLIFGILGDREDDTPLRRVLALPSHAVVSDAWEVGQTHPHPGTTGAFPGFLRLAVREGRILTLEEAIRKITSLPASRLPLEDRGRIAVDAAADVVVFDPGRIAAVSTYEDPRRFAEGIEWVIVNGKILLDRGRFAPAAAGKVLRKRR